MPHTDKLVPGYCFFPNLLRVHAPVNMPTPAFSSSDARDENGRLIRELHGLTLAAIVEYLHAHYGWPELDERLRMNCFAANPSIKSALTLVRVNSLACRAPS